jgi:hypothetical protein
MSTCVTPLFMSLPDMITMSNWRAHVHYCPPTKDSDHMPQNIQHAEKHVRLSARLQYSLGPIFRCPVRSEKNARKNLQQ